MMTWANDESLLYGLSDVIALMTISCMQYVIYGY